MNPKEPKKIDFEGTPAEFEQVMKEVPEIRFFTTRFLSKHKINAETGGLEA